MTRSQWLAAALALVLLGLGAVWFLRHFELREVPVAPRLEGEAATNALAHARDFLRAMGLPAATDEARLANSRLPESGAVLLIDTDRKGIDPARAQALLGWVRDGGHLIVRAPTPERSRLATQRPDALFEALGVHTRYVPDLAYPDAAERLLFRSRSGRQAEAEVFFVGYYALEGYRPDDDILFDENGVHWIHRRIGRGAVTLLSDMDFLHNEALCEYDHALALWYLVNLHYEPPAAIWLVHSDEYPAFPVLLWRHAQPLFIATALLLAAWAWRSASRFGPLLPQPRPERRRLLEHIEASGRYHWTRGDRQRLVEALRWSLERRQSPPHRPTAIERAAWLAARTGQPTAVIESLLRGDPSDSPERFTAFARQVAGVRASPRHGTQR